MWIWRTLITLIIIPSIFWIGVQLSGITATTARIEEKFTALENRVEKVEKVVDDVHPRVRGSE